MLGITIKLKFSISVVLQTEEFFCFLRHLPHNFFGTNNCTYSNVLHLIFTFTKFNLTSQNKAIQNNLELSHLKILPGEAKETLTLSSLIPETI